MSKQEALNIVTVGDVLAGKYRVEKVLGMGGMGLVVAATHLDLREMRAVKLMRPDAESELSVERFLREARAVVRLRSEHVAEVYDVGRLENGAPYIVMEMLVGHDLSALQKQRGPFTIEEAVLYVSQACHALAEAHAAGIVHRDLKPGNLFLTRRPDGSDCIKVLDFGISKHTSAEGLDPEMTGARDLMGSPLYMAPEQMRSARKVDARADVWSLGAILYKLLVGRAPFHAPTVPEIFAGTLGKPARLPSTIRPDIPRGLDAIILRCLDKIPARRFSTASELLTALMPFGPWGVVIEEEGEATVLNPASRRSTIPPPVKLKVPSLLPAMPTSTEEHTRPSRPSALPRVRKPAPPLPHRAKMSRASLQWVEPSPNVEIQKEPDDTPGASVSPWVGAPSRPTQKPVRKFLMAGVSAALALAGAGVALLAVHDPSLPQALLQETPRMTAGANLTPESTDVEATRPAGAAEAARTTRLRPEGVAPHVPVDSERSTSQPLVEKGQKPKWPKNITKGAAATCAESERFIDLDEEPPQKTTVPIHASGKTTEGAPSMNVPAKPWPPRRDDPFQGRH